MNSIKRKINKFIRKNMLPIKNHWEVFFLFIKDTNRPESRTIE
jgi:hypothetical protein